MILTVDEHDRITGEEEKLKCHLDRGILHRAFLVMAFNDEGELLLARRSSEKKLWPTYWDGTVASHVRKGESYEDAARERLRHELGVEAGCIHYISKFQYEARYRDIGSENEICAILTADGINKNDLAAHREEISEIQYVSPAQLKKMRKLTPWLVIALKLHTIHGTFSLAERE